MISTEQIFADLFALASQVQGADWSATPIPLEVSTRSWISPSSVNSGQMPWLQQLELPEDRNRTGLGLSRRKLHALIDIVLQRQPVYPLTQPFSTILNSFINSMDALFFMQNPPAFIAQNFHNNIEDFYITKITIDEGQLVTPACLRFWVEIVTGQ
jgi:hypothetical protein